MGKCTRSPFFSVQWIDGTLYHSGIGFHYVQGRREDKSPGLVTGTSQHDLFHRVNYNFRQKIYLADRGFFLVSLLACTKSFAPLVIRVLVLFASLKEVNKPIRRNNRGANDFAHAKRLTRKKPLPAGYKKSNARTEFWSLRVISRIQTGLN